VQQQLATLRLNPGGLRQTVGAGKRARRRRNRARKRQNNGIVRGGLGVITQRTTRRPMAFRSEARDNGDIVIHNEELWNPIQSGVNSMVFVPGVSGLSRLDKVAKLYEQYRLLSCQVEYRTGSGTTSVGQIIAGIDYNAQTLQTSASAISNLMPREVVSVWENFCLTVDPGRAMKQQWLFTGDKDPGNSNAFALQLTSPVDAPGTLWVRYSVHFTSPSQSNDSSVSANAAVTQPLMAVTGGLALTGTADQVVTNTVGNVTFDDPKVNVQGNAPNSVVYDVGVNGLSPGQQFSINTTTSGLGVSSVVPTFKDENGNILPPGSVVPVKPATLVGGFWSSLWTITVSLAKLVVEIATLVGATNGAGETGETVVVVTVDTTEPPVEDPPIPAVYDSMPLTWTADVNNVTGVITGGTFSLFTGSMLPEAQTIPGGPLANVTCSGGSNAITIGGTFTNGQCFQVVGLGQTLGAGSTIDIEAATFVSATGLTFTSIGGGSQLQGLLVVNSGNTSATVTNPTFTVSGLTGSGEFTLTLCQIQ